MGVIDMKDIELFDGTGKGMLKFEKTLYNQCVKKYEKSVVLREFDGNLYCCMVKIPNKRQISVDVTIVKKYTIVELACGNKRYQGLATVAPCDEGGNVMAGIGIAYDRAFVKMCGLS